MPLAKHEGEELPESTASAEESRSKRFRFKRKKESSSARDSGSRSDSHRHHHRSKRHKPSPSFNDDPSAYDDRASNLPPETAFRESLFDALGDDEGAAFWQGVYGQPIHNYPRTYKDEETGELEQMNDDDYAQYVRRKMWEKSWEGIEAAREQQKRDREREKKNIRDRERTNKSQCTSHDHEFVFDIEFENSLKRGERRREKKRWEALWKSYLQSWEELQSLHEAYRDKSSDTEQLFLRNKIAWPVESGKRKDVNPEEIKRFFGKCTDFDAQHGDISPLLKVERIRWHPDKIQQRYGFMQIDESTMQGVTAVFQVFDNMWNDLRAK